jgi:hypothetical protein
LCVKQYDKFEIVCGINPIHGMANPLDGMANPIFEDNEVF